ncbi:hypothetical protein EI94DRAFT_1595425 [Lactarius quietus]|nr:hypothetical protein EI94DRAFT_1595425 [Lactarius quietus]
MSLTHFLPDDYSSLFDRFFDVFSPRTYRQVQQSDVFPSEVRGWMNIYHDGKSNTICTTFELPGLRKEGFQKENVSTDVHNDVLTTSGEISDPPSVRRHSIDSPHTD